jgi:hypothetical protein
MVQNTVDRAEYYRRKSLTRGPAIKTAQSNFAKNIWSLPLRENESVILWQQEKISSKKQ